MTANDQLPTIHYYSGSFKEGKPGKRTETSYRMHEDEANDACWHFLPIYIYTGLDHVEGWIERYADINDDKLGPIRRRVRVGHFRLLKNKGAAATATVAPAAI